MARVLAQQWISADGFAAGPGGEGDIFAAVTDATATEAHNRALLPGFGEVLLGRATYELFAAFWPYADDQPMAATVNAMRRTVASRTLASAPWGSHAPASVVPDAAAHVRAATADVVVWGSLTLMRSLLRDGLLTEVELFVAPVFLGAGRPLFGTDGVAADVRLDLVESEQFPASVQRLRYAVRS
jgi:dihydrofolate reductase